MKSLSGSLILSIAYGVNIESENDRFYLACGEAMTAIETATTPGAFLVDVFPIRMSSSQAGASQMSLQGSSSQLNGFRNGFLAPVSRSLRGQRRRASMISLTFRSSTSRNLLRFVHLTTTPSRRLTGTCFRRGLLPLHRSWRRAWRSYRSSLAREWMKKRFGV
jgi:hypothetical protein